MKTSLVREVTLYRYRYLIGYGLFVIFLSSLVLTDISTMPYGVSASEMNSSVASNSLNPLAPRAVDVINLPYHLLQKLSIGLFGLSPLAIRLPSVVLIFIASVILAFTLHQWFRRGIAILALLLGTVAVPFISMGRTGTASVLYMVLLLIILLAAVKLAQRGPRTFVWKVVIGMSGLLMIYMPLGVYALIALMVAGIFHPHVRYQLKRTRWWQFAILFLVSAVLLAPLVFAAITDKATLEVLFGIDALREKLTLASLGSSLGSIFRTLFYFSKPTTGEIMAPFLGLPLMLLVIFGLVRTIIDRHAARSYLLLIWLSISIPLLILNPGQFALLYVPCLILMAIGLETFLREWYRLFPRNPYARIGALVPLSLMVVGLVAIASTRYYYGHYYTDTTAIYNPGLLGVRQVLEPDVKTQLIVPEKQVAFYDILRSKYPQLHVDSQLASDQAFPRRIVLADAHATVTGPPNTILTTHLSSHSVLLRVYK